MVDKIQKNLSDADERKAGQESVNHSVDVVHEQEQKTVLDQAQEMLGSLKQSVIDLPDRMKQLFDREKTELRDRISHVDHEQSQEIDTQLLEFSNDLTRLHTSVKKTSSQNKSGVSSPYITPSIKERIASLGEKGSQGRTIAYDRVAGYVNTVSQSNRLVRYLSA